MLNLFDAPVVPPAPAAGFDGDVPTNLRCYNRPCKGRLVARYRFQGTHTGGYQKSLTCNVCSMSFGDFVSVLGEDNEPCSCGGTGREPEFGGGSGGQQAVHTVKCSECEVPNATL